MYCLRWWLPVFLLPLPAAPPLFLLLFILSYALQTRPWYVLEQSNTSVYCGAIIAMLFFTSRYWHAPQEPIVWSLPNPYPNTWLGKAIDNTSEFFGRLSAPTSELVPDFAPAANCNAGWTDLGLATGRSLFSLIPRPPACMTKAPVQSSATFVGIPGTKLGFALDWSMFFP